MPATTRPSLSSIVVKIRNYWFFSIVPKVLNFQCHKLLFLGGYIPPESSTKLYDISGRNYNVHVQVKKNSPFLSVDDWSHPCSSLRTCNKNRCEPVAKIVANPVTPERSSPTVVMHILQQHKCRVIVAISLSVKWIRAKLNFHRIWIPWGDNIFSHTSH